jgi:hypothetical protein
MPHSDERISIVTLCVHFLTCLVCLQHEGYQTDGVKLVVSRGTHREVVVAYWLFIRHLRETMWKVKINRPEKKVCLSEIEQGTVLVYFRR